MYTITLSIKHKEVFDKMSEEFQNSIKEDMDSDDPFQSLENIVITETSLSAELNASIEELEPVESN